jgi:hypothetical protein
MDDGSLGDLMGQFGMDLPNLGFGKFPMFGYSVEGRLGGFFLPFDMGIKFGVLPLPAGGGLKLDYNMFGLDVRYALVKQSLLKPAISVGVGFNYLSGGITKEIGEERKFNYPNPQTGDPNKQDTLTLAKPTVGINWQTASIDLKAQISKSFFFITPYAGFGAGVGFSKAGYAVETKVTDSGNNIGTPNAKKIFEKFGIGDMSASGFSSEQEFNGWSFRLFGGLSFNAVIVKIDLTGLYNLVDKNYGATLGVRFQI